MIYWSFPPAQYDLIQYVKKVIVSVQDNMRVWFSQYEILWELKTLYVNMGLTINHFKISPDFMTFTKYVIEPPGSIIKKYHKILQGLRVAQVAMTERWP